ILACGIAHCPGFRKMNRANRVRWAAAHQTPRRGRFPHCVCNLPQDAMNNAAQNTLRKTFRRRINRGDPPKMDRYLFVVLNHLELRMIHANPSSTKTRLAENNDALTHGDHFLHVMQIEPATHERLTQRIRLRFLQRCFENFLPPAKPAQRSFDHLAAETDGNITFFSQKMRELCAVLVTSQKMRQQIFHSLNAEPSQREQTRALDPG